MNFTSGFCWGNNLELWENYTFWIVKINNENLAKPLVLSERKLYLIVNDKSIVSLGSFEGNYFKPKRVFI